MRYEALAAMLLVFGGPSSGAYASFVELPLPVLDALEGMSRGEVTMAPSRDRQNLGRTLAEEDVGEAKVSDSQVQSADSGPRGRSASDGIEWVELLRHARAKKRAIHHGEHTPDTSPRSAESSLELIEMMKRAKDTKGGGK